MFNNDFELKGKWNKKYFENNKPIILEVGCGRGEYTTGLAEKFPNKNFIGIDYKGARLWRGCKTAMENNMKNVAFIRNKIELVCSFFDENEVDEIWITFPDPQPKKQKKRLTSGRFINNYSKLLKKEGIINLKTDSQLMYKYTIDIIKYNKLELIFATDNLYGENIKKTETHEIKTHYEKKFLAENKKINYLKFKINNIKNIKELPFKFIL